MSVSELLLNAANEILHIRKVSLETPKEGIKVTNANLVPDTGKGNETKKAPEDFQERMTTALAEMGWTRVVMTAYNYQSFLQINSERDFLVI